MELRTVRSGDLPTAERDAVRALLVAAFAGDFSDDDWGHTLGGRHVIATEGGRPMAHAGLVERELEAGGRRFRCGYVEAVATHPGRQGHGLGSAVMGEVGRLLAAGFELGALATGRHGFYERLGWERWVGPTGVRRRGEVVPTPEDDDAVMVLRVGASAGLDVSLPLSCPDRPGDVW